MNKATKFIEEFGLIATDLAMIKLVQSTEFCMTGTPELTDKYFFSDNSVISIYEFGNGEMVAA